MANQMKDEEVTTFLNRILKLSKVYPQFGDIFMQYDRCPSVQYLLENNGVELLHQERLDYVEERGDEKDDHGFKEVVNDIELRKMMDDIEQYGDNVEGEYREIRWRMERCYLHWCGYVKMNGEGKIDEEHYNEAERRSHGGFTSFWGFDCSHYRDYSNPMMRSGGNEYRDYDYVLGKIKDIIDYLVDNQVV